MAGIVRRWDEEDGAEEGDDDSETEDTVTVITAL
jgi:hypothetical protein